MAYTAAAMATVPSSRPGRSSRPPLGHAEDRQAVRQDQGTAETGDQLAHDHPGHGGRAGYDGTADDHRQDADRLRP
jgi:hypothetical protein